jgi:hypothetical protein
VTRRKGPPPARRRDAGKTGKRKGRTGAGPQGRKPDARSSVKRVATRGFPAAELPARARKILDRLTRAYPDARCALNHGNAYQLLVATILSAQ